MQVKSDSTAVKVGHKGPPNVDELANKGAGDAGDSGKVAHEMDGLKAKLEEVQSAIKGAPTAIDVQRLAGDIAAIQCRLGDAKGNYSALIGALEARVDELQTTAALTSSKAAQPEGIRAVAKTVYESDGYKGLFDAVGNRRRLDGFTPSLKMPSMTAMKAADPVIVSNVVNGIDNRIYRPGFVVDPSLPATIRSRIPSVSVSGLPTYYVPKETQASKYGAVHSLLTSAIDGSPTPKSTCVVADIEGFMVGSLVKIYAASDGALLGSGTVVSAITKTITVGTNEFDFDAAIGDRVVCENFGATAELGTKPSGHVGLSYDTFNLQTLAQLLPTTHQALKTWSGLQSFIERKLPERHERNLSYHLLEGTGTAPQLAGFRAKAGASTYAWSSGEVGDNRCDAIIRACGLLPWTSPIGVVMHQYDLMLMTQAKDSEGRYLATNAFGVWPLTNVGASWFLGPWELVFDFASARNEFTAINWLESSEFVESDDAELAWGMINDDFATNQIRARYESSCVHAIFGLWGYTVGTWDEAPSAV